MWIIIGIITLVLSLRITYFTVRRTTTIDERKGKEYWLKAGTNKFLVGPRGVISARNALALLVVPALLMTACVSVDEGIEIRVLRLTFDGESSSYEGPTVLKAGPVTLLFFNESKGMAAVNLVMHTGDETIQDAIDYIGEEPTTKHAPSWTRDLGTWKTVLPGESFTWEGNLEPGIYHMVCASLMPFGVWFGTGLTVED